MELGSEWHAWHDRMPGGPATLRVIGRCAFTTRGWTAALRRHEPQGPDPTVLRLDLVTARDPGRDDGEHVEVTWEEQTDARCDQVYVETVGAPAVGRLIEVEEVC